MYITRETDYAVRIAVALAGCSGRMGAAKLAEQNGIPARFTIKILRKLTAGGLLKSYMGAQGGYALARQASQISLLDVIETVEGAYCFSRCVDPTHEGCVHRENNRCKTQRVFEEITNLVRTRLAAQTLDKFV